MRHRGVQTGHQLLAAHQQLHCVQSVDRRVHVSVRGGAQRRLSGVQSQCDAAARRHVQGERAVVGHHGHAHEQVSDEVASAHGHQNRRLGQQDALHVVDQVNRRGHTAQSRQDSARARPCQRPRAARCRRDHAADCFVPLEPGCRLITTPVRSLT